MFLWFPSGVCPPPGEGGGGLDACAPAAGRPGGKKFFRPGQTKPPAKISNEYKDTGKGEGPVDFDTFAARVEALRQRLYRTAYLYLGTEADALEAVDEAVYQALRSLRQLRQPELFDTWITRILINACRHELRRRKRLSGQEALPESAGPDAYDGLPLKEAIGRLPEALRTVVILRYFTGYTQAETAAALGIPQGTVATRQRRALELLRLELGEEETP